MNKASAQSESDAALNPAPDTASDEVPSWAQDFTLDTPKSHATGPLPQGVLDMVRDSANRIMAAPRGTWIIYRCDSEAQATERWDLIARGSKQLGLNARRDRKTDPSVIRFRIV